jgi:hypothetical protein
MSAGIVLLLCLPMLVWFTFLVVRFRKAITAAGDPGEDAGPAIA